jgi:hypothetical protein
MSLISSGINRVRAYGLAAGVGSDGRTVNEPASVLVKWNSEHEDKLYQVYVDGEFAGVTTDLMARSIVVSTKSVKSVSSRIEVFAVTAAESLVDFGDSLEKSACTSRVRLRFPRSISLPFCGRADVFSDNMTGQIDYQMSMNSEPIILWPAWQDKCGFGLSGFGRSDFGFDGCGAVGFGRGSFGFGEFGFDADEIVWESRELQSGVYKFAVKITDAFGNSDEGVFESESVVLINAAASVNELKVSSYDKAQNQLVLMIN